LGNSAEKFLDFHTLLVIICGIVMGTIARIITLKVDTRQNPSFPSGYFINIIMGFVAASLGAVAIPALLAKEFTAVTFLTLAIQHFRETRNMEKESLEKLEHTEYTKRGAAYIDGIAKTFESRNYIAMLTALLVVLILLLVATDGILVNAMLAAISGTCIIYALKSFTKGKIIDDICTIREGKIAIEQSDLLVDGMYVSNILGTHRSRELFLNEGVAFVIEPKKGKFRLTIENIGQRQAILFEATRTFGIKRYAFTRRNFKAGVLIVAFVPIIRDPKAIIDVIKETPVLENSRKIHTIMNTDLGGTFNG